jgi:hypothetical protein
MRAIHVVVALRSLLTGLAEAMVLVVMFESALQAGREAGSA